MARVRKTDGVPQKENGRRNKANTAVHCPITNSNGNGALHNANEHTFGKRQRSRYPLQAQKSVRKNVLRNSPQKAQNRSKNWTLENTQVLIKFRVEFATLYFKERACRSSKGTTAEMGWKKISDIISTVKDGCCSRTSKQCRRRWETLLKAHRNIKEYCNRIQKVFSKLTEDDFKSMRLATSLTEDCYEEIDRFKSTAHTSTSYPQRGHTSKVSRKDAPPHNLVQASSSKTRAELLHQGDHTNGESAPRSPLHSELTDKPLDLDDLRFQEPLVVFPVDECDKALDKSCSPTADPYTEQDLDFIYDEGHGLEEFDKMLNPSQEQSLGFGGPEVL